MPDALNHASSPEQLRLLQREGMLSEEGLHRGLELLAETPPAVEWRRFLSVALLALGSALTLSGIVFFFAYNWDDLGRFAKLGMLQGGVLLTFVAAWRLGFEAHSGRFALLASSVLVGVTMAVYGQIYQTGADAWELFNAWMLLILPWVLASRFAAQWALWIVLANTTALLWSAQVLNPRDFWEGLLILLPVAAANTAAWLVWERGALKRSWMSARWLPRVLVCWVLFLLTGATTFGIFERGEGASGLLAAAALAVTCGLMIGLKPGGRRDLFMPTAALAAGLWAADAALIRLIFDVMDAELLGWMTMSAVFLGEAAMAVAWLLRMRAAEVTK